MLNLKQALEGGEVVVGTWMNAPSASQVEIIGHAGFDFVILDTEHSSYEISAGENLIRAADAVGIPALMRVLESQPALIGKVLDYGAQGIVIPHVNTAADARRAVQGAHYAPLGARGAAPTVRATHYGHISWSAHLSRARSETLVVLQIEGKEGIENLDEIMAVDGVNVLFIGAFDLSESLGVSGQLTHPMLLDTIGGIVERAKAKDVALGIWMPEPEQVGLWVKQGVQVITVANNDMIFSEGCRVVVDKVQAQISEHSR